jgi:penicillin amidase
VQYGDYQNYGYLVPPFPLALIGHNEDRGWALTMWAHDDVDIYAETFHPLDPTRVMYRGEWIDCEVVHERIAVRFGEDVDLTVRVTPHGPIITDLFREMKTDGGAELALFWVWQHVEQTDLEAFYLAGHARDLESFASAMEQITSPGLNFSYADAEGNIAWWAAGMIPIRPAHVNSKHVLDGALGRDEILGFVDFEDNPKLINPESGYIVTANNRSTIYPVGEVIDLRGYWQPTDRAGRITDLVSTRSDWSLEDFKVMQLDDFAREAPHVSETLLALLKPQANEMSPLELTALRRWEEWDFSHGTDSVGAAIYQYACDGVFRAALTDEMGPDLLRIYGSVADHWHFFKYFITDPDMPFWDDITQDGVQTRDEIVMAGYREAIAQMRSDLGGSIENWRWGRAHMMEFKHPIGYLPIMGRFLNIGPFEASGGAQIINNMLYSTGTYSFDTIAGPSTRRVIDFADPTHSYTILPTGNSGHVTHPNYADQAEMFMAGEYRVVNFTEEQIAANEVSRMRFQPE